MAYSVKVKRVSPSDFPAKLKKENPNPPKHCDSQMSNPDSPSPYALSPLIPASPVCRLPRLVGACHGCVSIPHNGASSNWQAKRRPSAGLTGVEGFAGARWERAVVAVVGRLEVWSLGSNEEGRGKASRGRGGSCANASAWRCTC
jgi:hypothetical protein